jgi:hypothetical protein
MWGFIDKTGKEVIHPQYVAVHYNFVEGLAVVDMYDEHMDTMTGYIDKNGNEAVKFNLDFSGTPFNNGQAVVADGGQGSYYFIAKPLQIK